MVRTRGGSSSQPTRHEEVAERRGGSSQPARDEEVAERRRPTASARRKRVGVSIDEGAPVQVPEPVAEP